MEHQCANKSNFPYIYVAIDMRDATYRFAGHSEDYTLNQRERKAPLNKYSESQCRLMQIRCTNTSPLEGHER